MGATGRIDSRVPREPLAKLLVSTVFEIAENPKLLIRRPLSESGICERAAIGHDFGILHEAHVSLYDHRWPNCDNVIRGAVHLAPFIWHRSS